jgi:hypothetical protein
MALTDEISLCSFADSESQTETVIEEDSEPWNQSTTTLTLPAPVSSRIYYPSDSNSRRTRRIARESTCGEGTSRSELTSSKPLTKEELKKKRSLEQKKQRELARAMMMKRKELMVNGEDSIERSIVMYTRAL